MTAHELKEAVREYANDNLPGWECAGVVIRMGRGPESDSERLVVLPTSDEPVLPAGASPQELSSTRRG